MKKLITKALMKRLDVLSTKAPGNVPAIVFIEPQGDKWLVLEDYHRGKRKSFTINHYDDYVNRGSIVFINNLTE